MVCLTFKLDVEDTWEILFFWEPCIWRSYVAYSQWGLIWFVLLGQKIGYSSVSGVSRLRVNLCIAPMLLACFRTLNPISRRNYCFMRKGLYVDIWSDIYMIFLVLEKHVYCTWTSVICEVFILHNVDGLSSLDKNYYPKWVFPPLFFLFWERICKLLQGVSTNYFYQFFVLHGEILLKTCYG